MKNKTQKEYLDSPSRCPHCDSDDIEGGHVTIDSGGASQTVSCLKCDSAWVDDYQLIGYKMEDF